MKNFKKIMIFFGVLICTVIAFQISKIKTDAANSTSVITAEKEVERIECPGYTNYYSNVTEYFKDMVDINGNLSYPDEYHVEDPENDWYFTYEDYCEMTKSAGEQIRFFKNSEVTFGECVKARGDNAIVKAIPKRCFKEIGIKYSIGKQYGFVTDCRLWKKSSSDPDRCITKTTVFIFKIETGILGYNHDGAKTITTRVRPMICTEFLYYSQGSNWNNAKNGINIIIENGKSGLVMPFPGTDSDTNEIFISQMNTTTSVDDGAFLYGSEFSYSNGLIKKKVTYNKKKMYKDLFRNVAIESMQNLTDATISAIMASPEYKEFEELIESSYSDSNKKADDTPGSEFLWSFVPSEAQTIGKCILEWYRIHKLENHYVLEKAGLDDRYYHIYSYDEGMQNGFISNSAWNTGKQILCGVAGNSEMNTSFIYEKTTSDIVSAHTNLELGFYFERTQKTLETEDLYDTYKQSPLQTYEFDIDGVSRHSLTLEGKYKGNLSVDESQTFNYDDGTVYYRFNCLESGKYNFGLHLADSNTRLILFDENAQRLTYSIDSLTYFLESGKSYFIKYDRTAKTAVNTFGVFVKKLDAKDLITGKYNGELKMGESAGSFEAQDGDVFYSFNCLASGCYSLGNTYVGTKITLYDANAQVLFEGNTYIKYNLEEGNTYYVKYDSAKSEEGKNINLYVTMSDTINVNRISLVGKSNGYGQALPYDYDSTTNYTFVVPETGTYRFYTEGDIDTIIYAYVNGQLKYIEDDQPAYDDCDDDDLDAFFNYRLNKGDTVTIVVSAYRNGTTDIKFTAFI